MGNLANTLVLLAATGGLMPVLAVNKRQADGPATFAWDELEPSTVSEGLNWTPCYRSEALGNDNVDCARLAVPMDYDNKNSTLTDGKKVILALMRLRARDTANYKGPILHNPGGPGVPILAQVNDWYGAVLQAELGLNQDLIFWDPRGTGFTIPRQQCWTSDQRRGVYLSRHQGVAGQYEDHRAFLNNLRRYYMVESASCEDLMGADGVQRYISTYHHAHDMRSIMEALGETQVRYYGVSWGTALGNYFATLFPSKVGRMVLDANIDIARWPTGDLSSDFSDVETILERFFEECANDSRCDIHEPTAKAVEERYENIMELARLNATHAQLTTNWLIEPPIYTSLVARTQSMGYAPENGFPDFARMLGLAERSVQGLDPTPESSLIGQKWAAWPDFDDNSYQDSNNPDHSYVWPTRGEEYTRCNDIGGVPSDVDSMLAHFEDANKRHRAPGHELQFHWPCQGKSAPKTRFEGPFGGKTSNPILYINSRLDPITPLVHAERNAKLFKGSGLVIAEGMGHGVNMGRNGCALKHIRQYLNDGSMPEFGTTCADEMPILWRNGAAGDAQGGSTRRTQSSEAMVEAEAIWRKRRESMAW